jgi:phage repressor protein C with HTH and peptisase S24 domain
METETLTSQSNADPALTADPAHSEAFRERLRLVIGERSVRAFAQSAGISETVMRQYLAGKSEPTRPVIVAIARCGQVEAGWLVTGDGPMRKEEEVAEITEPVVEDEFYEVGYWELEAGQGQSPERAAERTIERLAFRRDWLHQRGLHAQRLALLIINGDSMGDTIPEGSVVLVERYGEGQDFKEDGIYALRWDDHLIVRRLQRDFEGGFTIITDNKVYKDRHIPKERARELQVAGRVVWIGREV